MNEGRIVEEGNHAMLLDKKGIYSMMWNSGNEIYEYKNSVKTVCIDSETARRLGIGRFTVRKYKTGNPILLNQYGIRQSKLDVFCSFIIQCIDRGYRKSKTVKAIYEQVYDGGMTNACNHM